MLLRKTIFAAIAALMCVCVASDAMAQRGGNDSLLQFLGSDQVQKEIDLLDDQKEQIKEVQDEVRDIMREAFSGMREKFQDLSREERNDLMTELREQIKEDTEDAEKKVEEILVPHQLDRLKQLQLQSKMRRGGTADALADALGLSEDEAEKLKEKEEEVKKELEEDIKKLREKALDKTLSVLPADKREKAKELIGEAFEQQRTRGGNRGGGGGARGGNRGGNRGGGGNRGRGGDRGGRGDF